MGAAVLAFAGVLLFVITRRGHWASQLQARMSSHMEHLLPSAVTVAEQRY